MGVRVYFESEHLSWACEVAYFKNEDIFDACTDALEAKAKSEGYILTESVEEEETCVTITFDEYEKKKTRSYVWVYQYRESGGEDAIELFSQIPTRSQLNKIILDNLGIDAEALRAKGETLGLNDRHDFGSGFKIATIGLGTAIQNSICEVKGERESYVPAPEDFYEPEFYESLYQQYIIRGEE